MQGNGAELSRAISIHSALVKHNLGKMFMFNECQVWQKKSESSANNQTEGMQVTETRAEITKTSSEKKKASVLGLGVLMSCKSDDNQLSSYINTYNYIIFYI